MKIEKQSNGNRPNPSQNTPLDNNTAHSQTLITCTDDQVSPLSLHDIGITKTPERHVVLEANKSYFEEGYDSYLECPPWEQGNFIVDKERQAEELSLPVGEVDIIERSPTPVSIPSLSVEEASKMKVHELKKELKKRGLAIRGKKTELLSCLTDAINSDGDVVEEHLSI